MSGILFFNFASCEPLTKIGIISFLILRFNSAESITDGVDASTRCKVAGNSNEPWKPQLAGKTGRPIDSIHAFMG